jgi:hypothetical protein
VSVRCQEMAKGTGLVKSRDRYRKLIAAFPERTEFYLAQIADVEQKIVDLGVCKRCGRPLKDENARRIGYGKECQTKAELEAKTE